MLSLREQVLVILLAGLTAGAVTYLALQDQPLADNSSAFTVTPMLAAGVDHVLALKADGTVWAWGSNASSQLGRTGHSTGGSAALPVSDLTTVRQVAAGAQTSLALKADGTVWAWGVKGTTVRPVPYQVTGLPTVTAISAGRGGHFLALASDGSVWAWGNNGNKQVSPSLTNSLSVPAKVVLPVPAKVIAAGGLSSYAVGQSGAIYAWGGNANGELCNGSTTDAANPQAIVGGQNTNQLFPADHQLYWRTVDQQLMTCGALGSPFVSFPTAYPTPTSLFDVASYPTISAGQDSLYLLKADGTVSALGRNDAGLGGLGTAATASYLTSPQPVPSLVAIKEVSAGANFVVARSQSGQVFALGYNGAGQLGDGTTVTAATAVTVGGYQIKARRVFAGQNQTAVLLGTGGLWSAGANNFGQLGQPARTLANYNVPQMAAVPSALTAVDGEAFHILAVDTTGALWSWGSDSAGELGDGQMSLFRREPQQIAALTNVKAAAAGLNHSLALLDDGTVWAWGLQSIGSLEDGSNQTAVWLVPTQKLADVQAIAAGGSFGLALKNDGTVWAWGDSPDTPAGQVSAVPHQVAGLEGITMISAGFNFATALKTDGTVWAWGFNHDGQLGNGSTENRIRTPVQVSGLANIWKISTGWTAHSLALKADGTVWAWGGSPFGQVGVDGAAIRLPVKVSQLNEVIDLAAGDNHSVALKNDGTVWIWGSNDLSQIFAANKLYTTTLPKDSGYFPAINLTGDFQLVEAAPASSPSPTPTLTSATPTPTSSASPTLTASATPSTPSNSLSPSVTAAASATPTPTPTATSSSTPTTSSSPTSSGGTTSAAPTSPTVAVSVTASSALPSPTPTPTPTATTGSSVTPQQVSPASTPVSSTSATAATTPPASSSPTSATSPAVTNSASLSPTATTASPTPALATPTPTLSTPAVSTTPSPALATSPRQSSPSASAPVALTLATVDRSPLILLALLILLLVLVTAYYILRHHQLINPQRRPEEN